MALFSSQFIDHSCKHSEDSWAVVTETGVSTKDCDTIHKTILSIRPMSVSIQVNSNHLIRWTVMLLFSHLMFTTNTSS